MNGFIVVIFIILYFAFKFLKAKDSEENYDSYSRRPYDPGYPLNRVVPPNEDVSEDFEDDKGMGEQMELFEGEEPMAEEPMTEEHEEEHEEENEDKYEDENQEGKAPAPETPTKNVAAPEAYEVKMPEPMSIPTMEIVVDSEVQLDAEMSFDKFKK